MDRYCEAPAGGVREKGGKKAWTAQEDHHIVKLVGQLGCKHWSKLAKILNEECGGNNGVERSGKQCRERWHNHLDSSIKKGPWTKEEETLLVAAHTEHGNQWSKIAKLFHGRTDNAIKNRWFAKQRRESRRSGKAQDSTTSSPSVFSDVDDVQLTPRRTPHDRVRALASSEQGGISPKPEPWMQHSHSNGQYMTAAVWNHEAPYLHASSPQSHHSHHHAASWRPLRHNMDEMGAFDLSMMPDDEVDDEMDACAYTFSMLQPCPSDPTPQPRQQDHRDDVAPPLRGSGFPLVEIDLDWTDKVLI